MQSDASVHVRDVNGRYPYGPAAVFDRDNLQVSVEEVARVVRIRIDDSEHPDAWMELTLEIES